MANSSLTQYIPPKGEFERFENEDHYLQKMKEWGLSTKKQFWYKDRSQHTTVTIIGYEIFGETAEYNTLVIEFQDGHLSCIHPAYLKEMQSSNFGKDLTVDDAGGSAGKAAAPAKSDDEAVLPPASEGEESKKSDAPASRNLSKPSAKPKKEQKPKIVLPEEKVHFTARVKQFALSWNHYFEMNDEVVIFEDVKVHQEEPIEIGLAWGSHSKTLKKLELEPGQELEFDGKIVKKSLPKGKEVEDESMLLEGPVGYKLNNPSKIVKK